MAFSIERKGYNKAEVDKYIVELRSEYDEKLAEQRSRIFALKNDLAAKEKEIEEYKSKTELISVAILNAVQKADEIQKLSAERYRDEMSSLRAFHEKWTAHYNKLLERYPDDDGLRAIERFNCAMDDVLSGGGAVLRELDKQFESESARLESLAASETADAAPEGKSDKKPMLAERAKSDNGFSFVEAWNPTDDLDQIMKDLGLMEDKK